MGFFDSEKEVARKNAQMAHQAGHTIFQYVDLIEATKAVVTPMVGVSTTSRKKRDRFLPIIQLIEEQGWELIHAGYVFQETGSESRDKFLASGQQVAVSGHVLGIYLFRAVKTQDQIPHES